MQPALRIFDHDLADGAEPAAPHELARLLHHDVAGVVVGEHENLPRLPDNPAKFERLLEAEGRGLVEDDVETFFKEEPGGWKMLVVGRDNDDEIEPLVRGHSGLGPGHLGVAAIDTRRIDEQIGAGRLGACRVGREGAGHELRLAIHDSREAVHGADECAATAADHAET